MKRIPDSIGDKITRKTLPPDCPYEKWKLLSHWWRMKVYGEISLVAPFTNQFLRAARTLDNPRDVSQFMTNPEISAILDTLLSVPLDFDRLEESSEIASWHMQTLMRMEGVVYSVSPRLARLLQQTDLKGVDCNLVRAPHHVMFVEIPTSSGLQVFNRDTGWHPVEGAYVVETDRVFDPEVFKTRKEPPLPRLEAGETFREIRVQVIGKSKNTRNVWDDACFNFRIPMDEGTIEDAINREMGLVSHLWGRHHKEARQVVHGLFNFVVNVLLYCTSIDVDIVTRLNPDWEVVNNRMRKAKSDKKRKRLQRELGKIDRQETQVIGSRLVVGKPPLDQESRDRTPQGTGQKLRTPHRVAGHWKGVWVGSEDAERAKEIGPRRKAPKWIQPYSRGDLAGQIHATYKVDLPEGDGC